MLLLPLLNYVKSKYSRLKFHIHMGNAYFNGLNPYKPIQKH